MVYWSNNNKEPCQKELYQNSEKGFGKKINQEMRIFV